MATHARLAPRPAGAARARTWWGKAWVRAVEEAAYAEDDLRRGRRLARGGRVGGITVEPGRFLAAVEEGDDVLTVSGGLPELEPPLVAALAEVVAGGVGTGRGAAGRRPAAHAGRARRAGRRRAAALRRRAGHPVHLRAVGRPVPPRARRPPAAHLADRGRPVRPDRAARGRPRRPAGAGPRALGRTRPVRRGRDRPRRRGRRGAPGRPAAGAARRPRRRAGPPVVSDPRAALDEARPPERPAAGGAHRRVRRGRGRLARHQRRRRARPRGPHHRLRAVAGRRAGPAGPRPAGRGRRRAGPARRRDLRGVRAVRSADRRRPARGTARRPGSASTAPRRRCLTPRSWQGVDSVSAFRPARATGGARLLLHHRSEEIPMRRALAATALALAATVAAPAAFGASGSLNDPDDDSPRRRAEAVVRQQGRQGGHEDDLRRLPAAGRELLREVGDRASTTSCSAASTAPRSGTSTGPGSLGGDLLRRPGAARRGHLRQHRDHPRSCMPQAPGKVKFQGIVTAGCSTHDQTRTSDRVRKG